MLYNSIPLYCTDVTSTLACWLPEDAEEFAENLQPFSEIENAQEKARTFVGKCTIDLAVFHSIGKDLHLLTFQHAPQAAFSLTKLGQSGQDSRTTAGDVIGGKCTGLSDIVY